MLDANTLVRAQDAGQLEPFARALLGRVAVPQQVWDELTDSSRATPGTPSHQKLRRAHRVLQHLRQGLDVRDIALETPAAKTYQSLRAGRTTTTDAGEDACVALAVHDPELIVVTHEARAAFRAVCELDRRVVALPGLLRHLVEEQALALEVAEAIVSHDTRRLVPTWWAEWCQEQRNSADDARDS